MSRRREANKARLAVSCAWEEDVLRNKYRGFCWCLLPVNTEYLRSTEYGVHKSVMSKKTQSDEVWLGCMCLYVNISATKERNSVAIRLS